MIKVQFATGETQHYTSLAQLLSVLSDPEYLQDFEVHSIREKTPGIVLIRKQLMPW